ncbi:MAG: DUF6636 domain-containing protein [Actinomycetes bacterium]
MTDENQELRSGLHRLADAAAPTDLTARAHGRAAQIRRRRAAAAAVAAIAAAVVTIGGATQLLAGPDRPVPAVTPTETPGPTEPSPTGSPTMPLTEPPADPPTGAPAEPTEVGGELPTAPLPVAGAPLTLDHFVSPSGNIACILGAAEVACEMDEHSFALPPRDCGLEDYVATFRVSRNEPPVVGACQTDTAFGVDAVLPYGSTSRNGDLACQSQEVGMTCWSRSSGHGFSIARGDYVLF